MKEHKKKLNNAEKLVYVLDKLQASSLDNQRQDELNNLKQKLLLKMGKIDEDDNLDK